MRVESTYQCGHAGRNASSTSTHRNTCRWHVALRSIGIQIVRHVKCEWEFQVHHAKSYRKFSLGKFSRRNWRNFTIVNWLIHCPMLPPHSYIWTSDALQRFKHNNTMNDPPHEILRRMVNFLDSTTKSYLAVTPLAPICISPKINSRPQKKWHGQI